MQQIILIIHFLVALFLIVVVLIQRGKGATLGSAFGSGASSTVFGSKGSVGFLMKLTMGLGLLFFSTSIVLTYISAQEAKQSTSKTIITSVENISKVIQNSQQIPADQTAPAPAVDGAKPVSVPGSTEVPVKPEVSAKTTAKSSHKGVKKA